MSENDGKKAGVGRGSNLYSNVLGASIFVSGLLYLILSHAFKGNIEKLLIYAEKAAEMLG